MLIQRTVSNGGTPRSARRWGYVCAFHTALGGRRECLTTMGDGL
jgi:hypothetical protein